MVCFLRAKSRYAKETVSASVMGNKGKGTIPMATKLKVREIAELRGKSQRRLFFDSEVDIKTLQKIWKNPTTIVTTITLDRLATALNVDVSLLVESDPPLPKTLE